MHRSDHRQRSAGERGDRGGSRGVVLTDVLPAERAERRGPTTATPRGSAWLIWAARFGYAACGLVYIAIGCVAAAVAMGLAERSRGAPGVMRLLVRQPLGEVLLVALGVGLVAYAALNFAGAVRDPARRGRSAHGIAFRAVDALTGALYIALAAAALRIVADPAHDGGRETAAWAAHVLALPSGAVILGAAGIALLGSAAYLLYRAWTEPFEEKFDRRALSAAARRGVARIARAGTAARGVIVAICGVLVIRAAAGSAPERVADVGEALDALGAARFGPALLAMAAVGFVSYGVYQLAKARWRRM